MLKKIKIKISELKENITNHPGQWLIGIIIFLFLISCIGLVILNSFSTLQESDFGKDLTKAFLDMISIVVIGTVLSLISTKYNQKQEEFHSNEQVKQEHLLKEQETKRILEENKNQFRKDVLRKLHEIYSGVKGARRMLRARVYNVFYKDANKIGNALVNQQVYDNYLENINSYQLDLENIKKELNPEKEIFVGWKAIETQLEIMEKYIHSLIEEYELKRSKTSINAADLPVMNKMLQHADVDNPFETNFIEPYHIAVKAVWKELLYGNENLAQNNKSSMSTEQNKAIVKRFFDEVCNGKNLKAINEIFEKEVSFNGNPGTYKDVIKYVEEIQDAFKDAHVEINKQLAEEDRVSTMRTWTGVQIKDYRNHPPTNKLMTWTEISVVRLEDAKIVEDWVVRSELIFIDDNTSNM